jgi:Ca2+-binding RTX toxin-like protein
MRSLAGAVVLGMLVLMASSAPVGAGGPDKACVSEIRAAGDWGKTLNPGKAEFVSGTEGDDVIDTIAPGVVFCGLGGDDVVAVNNGWFYGGDGIDTVTVNNAMFDGGTQTDVVITNNGVFNGRESRDVVLVNNGWFNGGPGVDLVQDENNGTCVDVEEGC